MDPLHIQLFGGVQIVKEHEAIQLGQKQAHLLAFLAVRQRPFLRTHLVETVWPDIEPTKSRRQLSDMLYRLRKQLGNDCFCIDNEQISLNCKGHLNVDVWSFQTLAQSSKPADWQTAVSLYKGDLLPQFDQDWVLERRIFLQETYFSTLLKLAEHAEYANDQQTALQCYQLMKQTDPLQENATRGVMRTLAKMGRLDESLRAYETLSQNLSDILQCEPTQLTQTLATQLQQEYELQTAVKQNPTTQPFVGRLQERAQLLSQLNNAAKGNGRITTILGEAGIGKSRLLQSVAEAAEWRGWQITWGRGEAFTHPAPYAPFSDALAQALPTPRLHQLEQLIRPAALHLIKQTIASSTQNDLGTTANSSEENEQTHQQAIYQVLHGLQQITPHLLILDDVQWADEAIWPLLNYLQPTLQQQRIFILLAGRLENLRQQEPVWHLLQDWDNAHDAIIHLQGLNNDDLQEIATQQNKALSSDELHKLQQTSGGNPLFVLNLLSTTNLHDDPSQTLTKLVENQITAVSEPAQLALQAASVLGYQIDYALWETVLAPIDASDLPQLAGELEQAQLLHLVAHGYRFAHDTLRAAVYNNMPPRRRQRLHQNALDILQQAPTPNAMTMTFHAEQANDKKAIAKYALLAAENALARYSYKTAVTLFSKALKHLSKEALTKQFDARYGRIQANDILANRTQQEEDLTQLHRLAEQLNDPIKVTKTHSLQARFDLTTGELNRSLHHAQLALTLAQNSDDRTVQAHLHHQMSQALREQGKYSDAQQAIQHAQQLYQKEGHQHGIATTTDILGGLAWAQGNYQLAIKNHAQAAQLFHTMGNPFQEAMSLNNLGSAYWGTGEYQQAQAALEQALILSRELGHKRGEGDNLDNMGGIAWVLADYETAVSYYSQALEIRQKIDDQWGISISLGNLGSAYRLMGDYQNALQHYAKALKVNRGMGRRRGEGYNLHGRGLTYLDLNDLQSAQTDLLAAYEIRVELAEVENQLETIAGLGIVSICLNQLQDARAYLHEIESRQKRSHRTSLRQWTHYAAFSIHQALGNQSNALAHLHQAQQAMQSLANSLPEKDRERYYQNFPLNRQIQTAVSQHTHKIEMQLVHKDVPLGRKLTAKDYTSILWTITDLEDQTISSTAKRRHHIIQRLIQEAEHQNATPTDQDLATALNVSRRTILRDMKTLNNAGITLPTRKR